MDQSVALIDPEGDVLITNPPLTSFAEWDETLSANPESNNPRYSPPWPFIPRGHDQLPPELVDPVPYPGEQQFRVSSKKLSSASHRLRRMFEGPWLEATMIHADGLRHWDLEALYDHTALKMVMSAIRGRRVPKHVTLTMLAKIAVVVDDLRCQDAVKDSSEQWISGERQRSFREVYDRNLVLWILIASVFDKKEFLLASTRLAIRRGTGGMSALGLPIRPAIVGAIDHYREELLEEIIKSLHKLRATMLSRQCTPACDVVTAREPVEGE